MWQDDLEKKDCAGLCLVDKSMANDRDVGKQIEKDA